MDLVQFIPLLIVLALVYFFIIKPLMARSKRAQAEGKNVIQSIPYTRFLMVGAFLMAASYFFGDYVAREIVRERVDFQTISAAANLKYYSWGAFFLGLAVFAFGAIKALLDRPASDKD